MFCRLLYSLIRCVPDFFRHAGGGIPRSVSTPYPREQWNEQAPGIPRQPAHNHRNCHRCRRSATYLETAESCRQQGNSLLPWIEQSSAVRLIGLLAGHPPLFDWEGVLVRKDATSVRIRLSGTRMEGVLHEGQYPVYLSAFTDLAWRRCCAAPNTSAVNTPSSPTFPKICPLNTTLRRIPSPTPKSTIRSSGTNPLFPVSANGWAEARPSIP